MENASKNAGEMINKYVPPLQAKLHSNNLSGSRSCTTVSARPPLPASWLRLLPVPPPVRKCRSLLLREEVASSVDFIFRSTFSLCKIRVNPFQFHMYTGRQTSVFLFWSIDNIIIDLTLVHVGTR